MRTKHILSLFIGVLVLYFIGAGSLYAQPNKLSNDTSKTEPTISEIAHKYALNHKEMVVLVSEGRKAIKSGKGKVISGEDIGNTIKKYLEKEKGIPAKVFVRKGDADGTGLTLIIKDRSYDIFNLSDVKKKLKKPILVFKVKFPGVNVSSDNKIKEKIGKS